VKRQTANEALGPAVAVPWPDLEQPNALARRQLHQQLAWGHTEIGRRSGWFDAHPHVGPSHEHEVAGPPLHGRHTSPRGAATQQRSGQRACAPHMDAKVVQEPPLKTKRLPKRLPSQEGRAAFGSSVPSGDGRARHAHIGVVGNGLDGGVSRPGALRLDSMLVMTCRTLLIFASLSFVVPGCQADPIEGQASNTATEGESTSSSGGNTHNPSSGPSTNGHDTSGASDTDASDTSDTNDTNDDDTGPVCGNAVVEEGEECDLGADNGTGDYCKNDCTVNYCGDGYRGPGEACDLGDDNGGDECTEECALASCGDGRVQRPEECDLGRDNDNNGPCLQTCLLAKCGDSRIWTKDCGDDCEVCDGPALGDQTCSSQGFDGGALLCASDCKGFNTSQCYVCGDNVKNGNEVCDGSDLDQQDCESQGFYDGVLACAGDCQSFNTSGCTNCGNGMINAGEECDGEDLGGASCESRDFDGGTLACMQCQFDESGCFDCEDGEEIGPNGTCCSSVGSDCGGNSDCCGSTTCCGGTCCAGTCCGGNTCCPGNCAGPNCM
jgi:hypothetical protein